MSVGRLVWNVISVVAILIALLTAFNVVTHRWIFPFGPIHTVNGDDDPIIVSGGSMNIRSKYGFQEHDGDVYTADHVHRHRVLQSIDIWYGPGSLQYDPIDAGTINGKFSVAFTYCPDRSCIAHDTVSVNVDDQHYGLNIANPGGTYGIGQEAGSSPGKKSISHQPTDWHLYQIAIPALNKTYPCDPLLPFCSAHFKYHCDTAGDCN